jgi:uncharacterized metal-binding protein YceD (DUF177 family)
VTAELERLVALDRVGARGVDTVVEANEAECAALARRFGIPAILQLRCRFRLRRTAPGVVDADGTLEARVTRISVVTLDDFDQDVAEAFELRFVPAGQEGEDEDPEAPDEIPYVGTALDLGEAAAEQLALALDPYPREPGVTLPDGTSDPAPAAFAALARLRKN